MTNGGGRRPGVKNRKTLIREALMAGAVGAPVPVLMPAPRPPRQTVVADAVWQKVSKGGRSKLTSDQMLAIVRAVEAGATQMALAAQYGVNQGTISRVCRAMLDTRGYAKQTLHAAAGTLATVAITASQIAGAAGDADPALELLDRLDVAPRRRTDSETGPRVVVMVGSSDRSALPPALLAVSSQPGQLPE